MVKSGPSLTEVGAAIERARDKITDAIASLLAAVYLLDGTFPAKAEQIRRICEDLAEVRRATAPGSSGE